jgi:hypothetical protein
MIGDEMLSEGNHRIVESTDIKRFVVVGGLSGTSGEYDQRQEVVGRKSSRSVKQSKHG